MNVGFPRRALTARLLTVGIATAFLAAPTPAHAASPATIFARSVYAAFEIEANGTYSIDIGARQDARTGTVSAQARGELELDDGEELYYFAYGGGSDAHLEVSPALDMARLDASIPIKFCFDDDGEPVQDPHCPVGARVNISAVFSSNQPLLVLHDRDESGVNVARGRLASAAGSQNGIDQGEAVYAEIVENRTLYKE